MAIIFQIRFEVGKLKKKQQLKHMLQQIIDNKQKIAFNISQYIHTDW